MSYKKSSRSNPLHCEEGSAWGSSQNAGNGKKDQKQHSRHTQTETYRCFEVYTFVFLPLQVYIMIYREKTMCVGGRSSPSTFSTFPQFWFLLKVIYNLIPVWGFSGYGAVNIALNWHHPFKKKKLKCSSELCFWDGSAVSEPAGIPVTLALQLSRPEVFLKGVDGSNATLKRSSQKQGILNYLCSAWSKQNISL